MRPVVSYDDVTNPDPIPESATASNPEPTTTNSMAPPQLGPQLPSTHTSQPPTKKRKTNQKASSHKQPPKQYHQHWDEPENATQEVSYDDGAYPESSAQDGVGEGYAGGEEYGEDGEVEEEEEESRELTQEEIWDDSALIDAWNSANAEYEAFHGKGKSWKDQPVKKSPLWYNIPPDPSKLKKKNVAQSQVVGPSTNGNTNDAVTGGDQDSRPFNFDTYVPSHDPTLASAVPPHPPAVGGPDYAQFYLPNPPGPMVSQDEAFQRALSAMYWGGYWTAMYHVSRASSRPLKSLADKF
ncbi:hypothetical protein K474DRAFT_1602815 [Panus rudis PR-1116 ss-1]|nr:hypothetical protein K474DRAFT_1602815 [Panus rudis PR-1116 ss-1]